eukprot:2356110-Pleurochrysis_carterae.AAC.1
MAHHTKSISIAALHSAVAGQIVIYADSVTPSLSREGPWLIDTWIGWPPLGVGVLGPLWTSSSLGFDIACCCSLLPVLRLHLIFSLRSLAAHCLVTWYPSWASPFLCEFLRCFSPSPTVFVYVTTQGLKCARGAPRANIARGAP